MNILNIWRNFAHFVLKRAYAVLLTIALLIVCFGVVFIWGLNITTVRDAWMSSVEPLIGIATLLVALLVWWGEARQDWLTTMPSKLTAIFLFNGRIVMRCELANLASVADIRALGQQLGKQMNKTKDLRINAPAIRSFGGEPEIDSQGVVYRHWTVEFPLLELPEAVKNAGTNEILSWVPPFDEEPKILQDEA